MARKFWATKTLLASDPDVNRRQIHATDESGDPFGSDAKDTIVVLNREMSVWTAEHEKRLRYLLKATDMDDFHARYAESALWPLNSPTLEALGDALVSAGADLLAAELDRQMMARVTGIDGQGLPPAKH